MQHVRFRSRIPVPVEELFAWHARDGAFERLVPPWQQVKILRRDGSIRDGDILHMRIQLGPLFKDWVALHSDFVQDVQFRDTQIKGPFGTWVHTHRTHEDGQTASVLDDFIEYRLPANTITQPLAGNIARAELGRMFRYRHLRTRLDLIRHYHYRMFPRISVAISGEHPFAAQLGAFVTGGGHSKGEANAGAVEIDLSGLFRKTDRYVSIQNAATGGARHVAVPDNVIGPSFRTTGLSFIFDRHGASGEHWIAEDDLIGEIYHAVLAGDSATVDCYRVFSDRGAAKRFLSGRL